MAGKAVQGTVITAELTRSLGVTRCVSANDFALQVERSQTIEAIKLLGGRDRGYGSQRCGRPVRGVVGTRGLSHDKASMGPPRDGPKLFGVAGAIRCYLSCLASSISERVAGRSLDTAKLSLLDKKDLSKR